MDTLIAWWNSLSPNDRTTLILGVIASVVAGLLLGIPGLFMQLLRRLFGKKESPSVQPPRITQQQAQQVNVNVTVPQLTQPALTPPVAPTLPISPTSSLPLSPAPIPNPSAATGFVARYDADGNDLIEMVSGLLQANQTVTLLGEGGVGKTTIAAEIAREMQNKGTRVVWVSAEGLAGFALGTLLDEMATQLGNVATRTLAPEEKSNAVRQLLTQARTLIVLDNFETIGEDEQKAIASFFEVAPGAALITSRVRVEGTRPVTVGAMSVNEARDFLGKLISINLPRDAVKQLNVDEIASVAERNPMVMRWIVGQLADAQRMKDVLDDLSRGRGDAAARVFGRSFALLNADAQAVLLSLPLFVPSANREALAEVAGLGDDVQRVNDALKRLRSLQLLETDAQNERMSVIGLTRRFANAQLKQDAHADDFRQRFVSYFLRYAKAHAQTTPEDFDALEAEKDNVLNAMDVAFEMKDWESVMRIMKAIAFPGLLDMHGYWDEAIRRGEQAVEAARAAKNEWSVAQFAGNAATIREQRGEYDEARKTYEEALIAFRKLGSEENVAVFLHQLGTIAYLQGDYAEARRRYDESLEIAKKLGDQSGIAITLHNLAAIAHDQGDYAEARRRYDESLEIKKKLRDQQGIAQTLHQLGIIAQDQGDYAEARRRYDESLEIKKKLGDQSGIARTTSQIGIVLYKLGKVAESRAKHEESLAITRKIGNQQGIAIDLHQLGMIAQEQGDYAEARRRYDESLEIAKKLRDQRGIAQSLHQLGIIAQDQGDYAEARRRYNESLEIAKKLGDQSGIASTLHQLGVIAENDGNKVQAERLFREALTIFEKLGSPNAEIARRSLERVEGKG